MHPLSSSEQQANNPSGLRQIKLADIPAAHPVHRFAVLHAELTKGVLLPHERDIMEHPSAPALLDWSKQIEPIPVEGGVDFMVLRQGAKLALREKRIYHDKWMSETLDPEFFEARHREIVAASIMRKPYYSRGATPTRERSFINVLRGVFPVFADTHSRLRLFEIAAEPYVVV